jgi:L-lactate dehydrogenase (cytochrome)
MGAIVNIEDLRRHARRRLPKVVFDFIDGGAQDEVSLRANRADFEAWELLPKMLVDVSQRSLKTTVLGREIAMPLMIAPTGLSGLATPKGELHAARAAKAAGTVYCLSTTATCSIEEIAAATGEPFWFQLYVMRDRGATRAMVERAAAAKCGALVLTIDLAVQGRRERDLYNGFTVPPRITARNVLEVLARPRWIADMALGPRMTFANFADAMTAGGGFINLGKHINAQFDQSVTWKDVDWLRSLLFAITPLAGPTGKPLEWPIVAAITAHRPEPGRNGHYCAARTERKFLSVIGSGNGWAVHTGTGNGWAVRSGSDNGRAKVGN